MLNNLLSGNNSGGNGTMMTIIFIVIIVAMIGLLVWQTISGKKKQKEAQNMVNQLQKGDRVKTIGGVCGFVVEINDAENTFVLETGTDDNKSYVKFDKGAIYQTAPANGSAVEAAAQAEKADATTEEPATEETPKKAKKSKKQADAE